MRDFLEWLSAPPVEEVAPLARFPERGLRCLLHRLLARRQITLNQFEVGVRFSRLLHAAAGGSTGLVAAVCWDPNFLRQPPPAEFEHPIERAWDAKRRLHKIEGQLKPKSLRIIVALLESDTALDAERNFHITRENVPRFAARALDELDDIFNGRRSYVQAA